MSRFWLSVWVPVGVAAAIFLSWGNWRIPLTNWDEGIFSHVSLEFSRAADWATPTYYDELHLSKPPLYYWASAGAIKLFGTGEMSLRLWSIVAGVVTTVVLSIWATQVFGRRTWGWLAGFLFLTGRFMTVHAFRTGDTDGMLVLFIVLALYAYWRAQKHPRVMIWWGVASGLAVMTKSAIGLIPVLIGGLDYLLSRGWRAIPWRWVGWGLLALIVVAAPWHIVMTIRYGDLFWNNYLGEQVVHRASTAFFEATPWYWYGKSILTAWFPWGVYLPLALIVGGLAWWRRRDPLLRLSLIWTLLVLIMFSASASRRAWYILPMYPGALFLMVMLAKELWARSSRWLYGGFLVSTAAAFYELPQVIDRLSAMRYLAPFGWLPTEWQTSWRRMLVALVMLMVMLIVSWVVAYRRKITAKVVISLVTAYFAVLAVAWCGTTMHVAFKPLPLQTLAPKIVALGVTDVTVVGIDPNTIPAGLYYLRRETTFRTTFSSTVPASGYVVTKRGPNTTAIVQAGTVVAQSGDYVLVYIGS